MSNDRSRSRTLTMKDLVPQYVFPDAPPDDLFYGLTQAEREFVRAYVEWAIRTRRMYGLVSSMGRSVPSISPGSICRNTR